MDAKPFEHFAIETAKSAGEVLMSYFGKLTHVNNKSTDIDLVTKADVDAERIITQSIQKEFPQHNIIAEESDFDKIDSLRGMDITISTSARTNEEARALLTSFKLPIKS